MSAIVLGKRSSSIFDELCLANSPQSASKRIRCSVGDLVAANLAHLRSLFPEMDQLLLEQALEESGNDLDSAIMSLNDLCLESKDGKESSVEQFVEGESSINPPAAAVLPDMLPKDGAEWVEVIVREMASATDMDDARARASRVLEVLEKSIVVSASSEAQQSLQKENMMLKEQVKQLLHDNALLKRAVITQHAHQKDYEEKSKELEHLKAIVSEYQEKIKALEINNYTLMMHLRQAQQSSSIPGRFHPDVF